jgi:hypothetical protein
MGKTVCQNKWCKSTFDHDEDEAATTCPKCRSMDQDLSGGVTWTDKTYEGPRIDGMPHQIKVKVTNYIR